MDPDACLRRLSEALEDGDLEEAKHAAQDLRDWLDKGGFAPRPLSKVDPGMIRVLDHEDGGKTTLVKGDALRIGDLIITSLSGRRWSPIIAFYPYSGMMGGARQVEFVGNNGRTLRHIVQNDEWIEVLTPETPR